MRARVVFSLIMLSQLSFSADLIVFSKDRPLQLDVFLRSLKKYVTGVDSISVVVRMTSDQYRRAYNRVWLEFPDVMVREEVGTDFKQVVLHTIESNASPYVIFSVDDIVVKDYVALDECERLMEEYNAYGFYLRLGLHLDWCYPSHSPQGLPFYKELEEDGCCLWNLCGAGDWGYPNTVDMTLYAKMDVLPDLRRIGFNNPNRLEGSWCACKYGIKNRPGLFYPESKVVNLPLNRVQSVYNNRCDNSYSTVDLLQIFNRGYTIDIEPLEKILNRSAHMSYEPIFKQK